MGQKRVWKIEAGNEDLSLCSRIKAFGGHGVPRQHGEWMIHGSHGGRGERERACNGDWKGALVAVTKDKPDTASLI